MSFYFVCLFFLFFFNFVILFGLWLCRIGTTVDNSDDKTYSIGQRHQIMIINMLQNWNHRYSSHYKIIKYIGFKSNF